MNDTPEWTPEQAIKAVAEVLRNSTLGKEVDMTEDESMDLANMISRRLEKGPDETP